MRKATTTRRKKQRAKTQTPQRAIVTPTEGPVREEPRLVPIVGIGASAGGLEALEQFFHHVPPKSGLAFVVVQHQDPTHEGIMMVELLQRATSMPVRQVKDCMKIESDRVYVMPPNTDMSVLHGVLHLLAPVAPRGLRLPIDYFFRSLADDLRERSIGVILSGMGSDGTLGLRAMKEHAGAAFVQAPASAKFDGMPTSAINAGLADVVAPVEELAGKILAYLASPTLITRPDLPVESRTRSASEKIFILLRRQTGHDFSLYKKNTVYRRIERRMRLHQIGDLGSYVRYLQENPQETQLLFNELLIGVTKFFRDPAAWERLAKKVLPALFLDRPIGGSLRAWVAGCSTGEEAYSLAIVFREAMAQVKPAGAFSLQIFATDLDKDAIDKARQGVYPANIAGDVSAERLHKFFVKERESYRVAKEIRETVIFAQQNVIMDPPFTKLDILACRNLLIYLSPVLQKKVLPLFHYSLNSGGVLFLGSAETAGVGTDFFAPLDSKTRIYRRVDSTLRPVEIPISVFPAALRASEASDQPAEPKTEQSLQVLADRLLLQRFAPPAVLTSGKGDILYVVGRTGKYLEPAAGKANWNIFAMARSGLRHELGMAFQKVLRKKSAVTLAGLKVGANGGVQAVDVTITPIEEPEGLRGTVMIVFAEVATPAESKTSRSKTSSSKRTPSNAAALTRMEQDLRQAREELQSTGEEMQSTQEELRSANEEMQSTNEELQSTNEELTTSKEEMQSMNEELQTLNQELQAKVDELSRTNNDMRNLLDSTDIATLFLDDALNVRRFTSRMAKIINLIPADAGRPLSDLASNLDYPKLYDDARDVLRTLVFKEKPIASHDGRWFVVRIMPYRTLDNRIDGLVLTFTDVTAAKRLERNLLEAHAVLEKRGAEQAAKLAQTEGGSEAEKPRPRTHGGN